MDVIVAASQKGGAGKTTLVRSLAVAAMGSHEGVALLDTDPQGTLTSWWNRREADTPILIRSDIAGLGAALAKVEKAGVMQVYVDTPPSTHPWVGSLLQHATFVLVPVRPTPDDLDAVGGTLDLIERAQVDLAFVISQAKPRTRLALEALPALARHGKVAPAVIYDRIDFPTAAIKGLAVTEHAPDGRSAKDARELLTYVLAQLRRGANRRVRSEANG